MLPFFIDFFIFVLYNLSMYKIFENNKCIKEFENIKEAFKFLKEEYDNKKDPCLIDEEKGLKLTVLGYTPEEEYIPSERGKMFIWEGENKESFKTSYEDYNYKFVDSFKKLEYN